VQTSQLIDHIASAASFDKKSAAALDGIVASVKSGDAASLLGKGVSSVTSRATRQGRNPRCGAVADVTASKGVRFKLGSPFAGDPQRQERGQEVGPREGGQGTCECGYDPPRPRPRGPRPRRSARAVARRSTTTDKGKDSPVAPIARKTAAAAKSPATRTTAKKAAVKRAPAKRATAKKAAVKRAPAKRATAKKAAVKRAPAKRATARKATRAVKK